MFDFLRRLMYGRYGSDALNQFLMVIALVLLIPWFFTHWAIFSILILALIILIYCRMFSRNIYKRSAENQKFLAWFTPIQRKLAGRKMQMRIRRIGITSARPVAAPFVYRAAEVVLRSPVRTVNGSLLRKHKFCDIKLLLFLRFCAIME